MEPATRQDIKDALDELKLHLAERKAFWINWVTVAFVAAHIK